VKIAMFTDTWLPTRDGIVTSIERFRESLERLGHDVYVFAPGEKTGMAPRDDRTFYFKARAFKRYDDYRLAFWPAKGKNELLQELGIELIHNHGLAFMALKAMFSSRQLKLPIVLHFHTWVTDAPQYYPINIKEEYLKKGTWRYLKSLCRRSDCVVTPSVTALRELKARVPDMRCTDWVSPGVDFGRFNPHVKGAWVREKHGVGDAPLLLHVGRISLEKNLELVFEALPLVKKARPGVKLIVVGSGPALDQYKELAKSKGLTDNVVFTGFVPDEQLPSYYAAADAFVIASTFETLGIVTVEAMACGTPAAGINCRVIPELIRDGKNGHLFEANPQDCAAKIIKTLDAGDDMGRSAFESVQRFDTLECGKKLVEIYEEAMKVKMYRFPE
jgi:1,2-diacylglycerol 3-alpha-glucosyltransferase